MELGPEQIGYWYEAAAAELTLYARQWLDQAQAHDAVQEAFVRLMGQEPPPDKIRPWLFRTVRNGAIDWHRARQRQGRLTEKLGREQARWFEADPAGRLDAQAAQQALENLPLEQREAVVLKIWGQLNFAQMAEIAGVAVSTMHQRYQEGLRALRKGLEKPCKTK